MNAIIRQPHFALRLTYFVRSIAMTQEERVDLIMSLLPRAISFVRRRKGGVPSARIDTHEIVSTSIHHWLVQDHKSDESCSADEVCGRFFTILTCRLIDKQRRSGLEKTFMQSRTGDPNVYDDQWESNWTSLLEEIEVRLGSQYGDLARLLAEGKTKKMIREEFGMKKNELRRMLDTLGLAFGEEIRELVAAT